MCTSSSFSSVLSPAVQTFHDATLSAVKAGEGVVGAATPRSLRARMGNTEETADLS